MTRRTCYSRTQNHSNIATSNYFYGEPCIRGVRKRTVAQQRLFGSKFFPKLYVVLLMDELTRNGSQRTLNSTTSVIFHVELESGRSTCDGRPSQ